MMFTVKLESELSQNAGKQYHRKITRTHNIYRRLTFNRFDAVQFNLYGDK